MAESAEQAQLNLCRIGLSSVLCPHQHSIGSMPFDSNIIQEAKLSLG